jgi:DNA polymerase-1
MLDQPNYHYLTDPLRAAQQVARLAQEPILGVDIETYPLPAYRDQPQAALDPYLAGIRLVQVASGDGQVAIFDLFHLPLALLTPLTTVPWVVFNGDFEYRHLTQAGLPVPRLHDVLFMDRLISHRLRDLAQVSADLLGEPLDKTLQTSDWGTAQLAPAQLQYAARDALACLRIAQQLSTRLRLLGRQRLYDLWCGALPVLADLELRGQAFDWENHARLTGVWQQERDQWLAELATLLGPQVNPASGKQLSDWFTAQLSAADLTRWPKTPKTGLLKMGAAELALHGRLPVVKPLLEFKKIEKLLNTYTGKYVAHRHPVTGCLHPRFWIGATRSGRISVSSPNTQQVPRHDDFRALFIPPVGKLLISADYSQIELVVAALLANDQAMLEVYRHRGDLHRATAAAIAGITPGEVTPEQRQAAKAVNFGNLYGQGPASLAETAFLDYQVPMTIDQARQALQRFDQAYPALKVWKRQQVAAARQFRKVQTPLGLVRDFEEQGEGFLQGEAQNIPIQGAAAEILMSALNRLPAALAGLDAQLYHTVHDELTLQVTPEDAEAAARALQDSMVGGFLDIFPQAEAVITRPEVKRGPHWAAVH